MTRPTACATCGHSEPSHDTPGKRSFCLWDDCTCTAYVPPTPTENTNLLIDPFAADLGVSASDAVVANGWAEDEPAPTPDPTVFGAYDGSSWPASIGPTTGDTDPRVLTVAQAIHGQRCIAATPPGHDPRCVAFYLDHAEAAVAALDAYDETALRERIAAKIEAQRNLNPIPSTDADWTKGRNAVLDHAARIARGAS